MYDLEDSVGISEKDIARDMLIDFLSSEDLNNKAISYRINEIRSPFAYKDVIYVIEKVGYKIQSIVVPKVESRDEIQWIHILLDQIEKSIGLNRKIEIEHQLRLPGEC